MAHRIGVMNKGWQDNSMFYRSKEWRRLRKVVYAIDKGECQLCKTKGYYKRGKIVHHVNHVTGHEDIALNIYYVDGQGVEQRNLVTVCFKCHEEEHQWIRKEKAEPLTVERW